MGDPRAIIDNKPYAGGLVTHFLLCSDDTVYVGNLSCKVHLARSLLLRVLLYLPDISIANPSDHLVNIVAIDVKMVFTDIVRQKVTLLELSRGDSAKRQAKKSFWTPTAKVSGS